MDRTFLLDISRILSRADGILTGVDRVELAYLRHFRDSALPSYALARTTLGYLMLDQAGMAALVTAIDSGNWPLADLMSRWNGRLSAGQKKVRSLTRALAVARCPKWGLARMLRARLSGDIHYINVGHTNLGDRTLGPIKNIGARVSVMVHDVIPLDFPQFQRPGTVEMFAAKLGQVSRHADRVICLTHATETAVRHQLSAIGPVPETIVAPLGISPAKPVGEPWFGLGLSRGGYFVCVGTIEPRKNHALLLDIWEAAAGSLPPLLICGARGWANDAVLARLDAGIDGVRVLTDVTDARLAAFMVGSGGLLFPSLAEGFGLPPVEAAALGVPVLASDLPVLRETLGDYPTYIDPADTSAWARAIRDGAFGPPLGSRFKSPDWESHFKTVLSMTC